MEEFKTRAIKAIMESEKAIRRIDKCKNGLREMKDSYLDVTVECVDHDFDWHEIQKFDHRKLIAECILEIIGKL